MSHLRWLLYGATGYTGVLVAEEAVKYGMTPVLAGRNAEKLRPLAKRLGLQFVTFDLDDVTTIARHVADFDVVYHSAGPFTQTSEPMIKACLATHTHYVDITGELHVLERTFSYDDIARKNGVALISGAGFDVLPSDSLAVRVAQQVPMAETLEIALMALGRVSAGTAKSMLELLPVGAQYRKHGTLASRAFGTGGRRVRFPTGIHHVLPIPWGDVATAYRSTGIPNITAYLTFPAWGAFPLRMLSPLMSVAFQSAGLRRGVGRLFDRFALPPTATQRENGKSYLWASARDKAGNRAEGWLETPEAYAFTAKIAPLVVERVAQSRLIGALTPAQAFGETFVQALEGVRYYESL